MPLWATPDPAVTEEVPSMGDALDIHVVVQTLADGRVAYRLQHGYDTDIFWELPGDGPFASREQAEAASDRLAEALTAVSD